MYKIFIRFFYLIIFIFFVKCNKNSSFDFTSVIKPEENPILKPDSTYMFYCPIKKQPVKWQKADVFNPAAIVHNNHVYLLFRCEDNPNAGIGERTSRIGLAYSSDGINFIKYPTPVLFPDSSRFLQYDYPGGCEDPRIVETTNGLFVMTYTSWNYKVARLSIAISKDLFNWEKKSLAFEKAYNGKFLNHWSKSGAIVTKWMNNKHVAAKINGKYYMYWGEYYIYLAWSDDLIDWTPLIDETGEPKIIVGPRKYKFDSYLTECGPPAIITNKGIELLYNGKNADNENRDKNLPKNTYSVGKVIFDIKNPDKVIYRSDTCLLKPTLSHEISGQYKSGTTFAEGLIYFNSAWFLYYGTADSFIGVAILR